MMMGNPALRLVELIRKKWRLIIIGAILGSIGGAIVGLTSPVIYRAATVIKITPKSNSAITTGQPLYDSFLNGATPGEQAVKDALNYIHSPIILEKAARSVMAMKLDPDLAFPNRIRSVDLSAKFRLMARRINSRFDLGLKTSVEKPIDEDDDIDIVATLISSQMEVIPNTSDLSIAINIDSSVPLIAKEIAGFVADEFIKYSSEKDQEKLKKQENYLIETLEKQESQIAEIEGELRSMRSKTPSLQVNPSGTGSNQSGTAYQYTERKSELETLDVELQTNQKLFQQYKEALKSADFTVEVKNEGLRKQLEKQLGELEYKRLEYTVIQGYPENHPQLVEIDRRIQRIKGLLQNLDTETMLTNRKEGDPKNKETEAMSALELRTRLNEIQAKVAVLKVKQELLRGQLSTKQTELKSSLEEEQRASTLLRDLETHLTIVNELRRRLEEIRIQVVGTEETASLLVPPALPLFPINLSVYKRILFGLIIGAAALITLIFLLDIINPRLLLLEDLNAFQISHFGTFKFSQDSMIDFTSCLLTLKKAKHNKRPGATEPTVILFTLITVAVNLESWISEIAILLRSCGLKCGVVIIDKKSPQIRRESMILDGVETNFIHVDEISFMYDQILNSMRETYDFVLVLSTSLAHGPATVFMTRSAEHVFYISKMGQSELNEIARVRQASAAEHISEYALILET